MHRVSPHGGGFDKHIITPTATHMHDRPLYYQTTLLSNLILINEQKHFTIVKKHLYDQPIK
jgi:hypothetical protein